MDELRTIWTSLPDTLLLPHLTDLRFQQVNACSLQDAFSDVYARSVQSTV